MPITATHIAYFHTCQRKLWLFHHGIRMEHNSEIVAEGKLIGESSYQDRATKYTELEIDGVKIDHYDPKNKIIHEVKKSNKVEQAHIAQVKYYLYVLHKNGIQGASAIIEYPKSRQRQTVEWENGDENTIHQWLREIDVLLNSALCPTLLNKPICKKCSYHDFCYINEPL